MKTKKISDGEIAKCSIGSLPTRPTSPTAAGGRGYTAREMKEAFDRLPRLIAERLNLLIEDICTSGEEGIAGAIPTEVGEGISLAKLISSIADGSFASILQIGEESLEHRLLRLEAEIKEIREAVAK